MSDGAIDNEFEDAEKDAQEILVERRLDTVDGNDHEAMRHPDVAIDLVSRQQVYILESVAGSLTEYYEKEDFDLYNYKMHPYLPVRLDDTVYKCVYLGGTDDLHRFSDTYDFPAGRLARVPVDMMLGGDD